MLTVVDSLATRPRPRGGRAGFPNRSGNNPRQCAGAVERSAVASAPRAARTEWTGDPPRPRGTRKIVGRIYLARILSRFALSFQLGGSGDGASLFELSKNDEKSAGSGWRRRSDHCPHCGSLPLVSGLASGISRFARGRRSRTRGCRFGSRSRSTSWSRARNRCRATNWRAGVTQKTAWFMLTGFARRGLTSATKFRGPVEIDESYIGRSCASAGEEAGKRSARGLRSAHAACGRVHDPRRRGRTCSGSRRTRRLGRSSTRTAGFRSTTRPNHSRGEYVRGDATTNGIESFWALLKRAYQGTFHSLSKKHLDRYRSSAGDPGCAGWGRSSGCRRWLPDWSGVGYHGGNCRRLIPPFAPSSAGGGSALSTIIAERASICPNLSPPNRIGSSYGWNQMAFIASMGALPCRDNPSRRVDDSQSVVDVHDRDHLRVGSWGVWRWT